MKNKRNNMCTILIEKCKTKQIGYKVVGEESNKVVHSLYYAAYTWRKGINRAWRRKFVAKNPAGKFDGIFHCFANLEDAQKFLEQWNTIYREKQNIRIFKIIKITLTKNVWKGVINAMGGNYDGLPAVCGSTAYWDGKFIT